LGTVAGVDGCFCFLIVLLTTLLTGAMLVLCEEIIEVVDTMGVMPK